MRENKACMAFKISFIPYEVDTSWIDPTLIALKNCMDSLKVPSHSDDPEHGLFIQSLKNEEA